MSVSQSDVNAWFAANPGATQNDVAAAVQSIGGLDANPGLAGMLANVYQSTPENVGNYYNNYTKDVSNTQSIVDKFFADNPNATASDAAKAVSDIGGLNAKPGLTEALAKKYSNTPQQITDSYTNYITQKVAPPTFNDVYQPWLSSYQQQFGTDINRPWNADQDSANVKASLDKQYIDKINQYNKQYGTNLKPDASVLGIDAQPNSFTVQPTGSGPGLFGGISDFVHHVGTTIAQSPILNTAAVGALTYFGVPPSVAAGIVSANAGAKPETIALNMLAAGIAPEIVKQVAPQISSLTGSELTGQVTGQAAGSATSAAITGRDPLKTGLASLVSGGANVAAGELATEIPGWSDMGPLQQQAVKNAMSATMQGKDPTTAVVQTAINVGKQVAGDYAKQTIKDFGTKLGLTNGFDFTDSQQKDLSTTAFLDAKSLGASNEEAKKVADSVSVTTQTNTKDQNERARQEPPPGLQLAAGPTSTVSDAGGGYRVEMGGAPIYAESPNADKVKVPFGYDLMPGELNEKGKRPSGAYYDELLNAWLMPNKDAADLQAQLAGNGSGVINGNPSVGVESVEADVDPNVKVESSVDPQTGATTVTTTNPNNNTVTTTQTDGKTQTTTNVNNDTGITTSTSSGGGGIATTTTITDPSSGDGAVITKDPATDKIVEVKTTGENVQVIDSNTVVIDDKKIDVNTGTVANEPTANNTATPTTTTFKPTTTKTTAPSAATQPNFGGLSNAGQAIGDMSFLGPQFLKTKESQKQFIDPLSLYRSVAATEGNPMQQISPQMPSDSLDKYYNYGKAESIDDILGLGKKGGEYRDSSASQSAIDNLLNVPYAAKDGGLVTPLMAAGGSVKAQKYAHGGLSVPLVAHGGKMRGDFRHGAHVAGPGDGQSDDIPAMLADGEYVLDSEIVAALGNGSTKAGSKLLDKFREEIRTHKRSGSINTIPPKSKSPLQYLSDAKKKLDKK